MCMVHVCGENVCVWWVYEWCVYVTAVVCVRYLWYVCVVSMCSVQFSSVSQLCLTLCDP